MTDYSLRYEPAEHHSGVVHFSAHDALTAMTMAHDLARDRPAELWQGNAKVYTIKRSL